LLGINNDLPPRSTAEAKALSTAVASYQFGSTLETKKLTAAFIALLNHIISGNIFDRVPALFIRCFWESNGRSGSGSETVYWRNLSHGRFG